MSDVKHPAQEQIRSLTHHYVPGEYWTHYKGGVYQLVSLAVQEDTGTILVIYKSLKHGTVWSRSIDNWCEDVQLPTGTVKRFVKGAP